MRLRNRSIFASSAVHALMRQEALRAPQQHANAVLHPKTGKAISFDQLRKDPLTKDIWLRAMTTELACLTQGLDGITVGTDTVFYLTHEEIKNIPK